MTTGESPGFSVVGVRRVHRSQQALCCRRLSSSSYCGIGGLEMIHVPLSSQWIDASDEQAVLEVLSSDHLSLGQRLPELEEGLARVAGVAHGIAVNSGC